MTKSSSQSSDNATLEAIAQAIFKEWFVDFNFPAPPANWSRASWA
jgi:hypothetical protein